MSDRNFPAFAGAKEPDLLVWDSVNKPAARFRNTAIGTLVQDLSEGMELVKAIISIRMTENAEANERTAKASRRRQIEQAIADSDAR